MNLCLDFLQLIRTAALQISTSYRIINHYTDYKALSVPLFITNNKTKIRCICSLILPTLQDGATPPPRNCCLWAVTFRQEAVRVFNVFFKLQHNGQVDGGFVSIERIQSQVDRERLQVQPYLALTARGRKPLRVGHGFVHGDNALYADLS